MIEPRIYRAAFVPALLALVLAMFSLESRPRPLVQSLAADVVFDGSQAVAAARTVLGAADDRRAGTRGNRAAADLVAASFGRRGFDVERDAFEHGDQQLVNVLARRAGESRREVVVVAARDATGVPDAAGSAADTAALLEVARVFEGRPSSKTLVLASVDGEHLGQVGARRLVDEIERPEMVDGVVVLSGFGTPRKTPAEVVGWSTDTRRAGLGLARTIADSLWQEAGSAGPTASTLGQLARLAFPLGVGPQATLVAEGYDAVRIAGGGELPPDGSLTIGEIDRERFGELGRATLRTLTALDSGGRPERGPPTYITAVSQVLPGWVLALLSFTLVLPALVASIDAFARARRRRESLGGWLAWLGAGVLPFVAALGLAHALALTGLIDDRPAAPVAAALHPFDLAAGVTLALVGVTAALAWVALRFLVLRTDPELADPSAPGAAVSVALVLSVSALALWALNPFAALLLVPALHLWVLVTLTEPTLPRPVRLAMVLGGLLLPALLALYVVLWTSVDPLSALWFVLLMVVGGQLGLAQSLIGCVLAGVGCAVVSIARRDGDSPAAPGPSVRGPGTYAGPGSLGGTGSALPRR